MAEGPKLTEYGKRYYSDSLSKEEQKALHKWRMKNDLDYKNQIAIERKKKKAAAEKTKAKPKAKTSTAKPKVTKPKTATPKAPTPRGGGLRAGGRLGGGGAMNWSTK